MQCNCGFYMARHNLQCNVHFLNLPVSEQVKAYASMDGALRDAGDNKRDVSTLGDLLGVGGDWLQAWLERNMAATPKPKLEGETWHEFGKHIEAAASLANEENDVELCWMLRGILDKVTGTFNTEEPGDCYQREYAIGGEAADSAHGHGKAD